MIPGSYFGMIVFAVETGASGFSYKNHPELYHWTDLFQIWVFQTVSLFNYYFVSHLAIDRIRILINYLPSHLRSPKKYHLTTRVACHPTPKEILYRVFSICHHKLRKICSLSITTWSSVLPWVYNEQAEETCNLELVYI